MAFSRIKEAAEKIGVLPHVLRFWENQFPFLKPPKTTRGQRLYSDEDIESFLKIKYLLYTEGYSISGAKKFFKEQKFFSASKNIQQKASADLSEMGSEPSSGYLVESSGMEKSLEREFLKEIKKDLGDLVGITREI